MADARPPPPPPPPPQPRPVQSPKNSDVGAGNIGFGVVGNSAATATLSPKAKPAQVPRISQRPPVMSSVSSTLSAAVLGPASTNITHQGHAANRTTAPTRGLVELRIVLPSAALDIRRSLCGPDAFSPPILGFDPQLPASLAAVCSGWWRVQVRVAEVACTSEVYRVDYTCSLPWLPVELVVSLQSAAGEGECKEVNALRMKPEILLQRAVEKHVLTSDSKGADACAGLSTVYCSVISRFQATSWSVAAVAWPALRILERQFEAYVQLAAHRTLRRYWQAVVKRWLQDLAETPVGEDSVGLGPASHLTSPQQTYAQNPFVNLPPPSPPTGSLLTRHPSVTSDGDPTEPETIESPDNSPRASNAQPAVVPHAAQHAFTKGMPFYNGFLYKLGDGLLNTAWNLRYFLLIGQSLQYYRSQHEAKPKDIINLSGATVEWVKDQNRPFVFMVSKSGQRTMCLSGNTEKESLEWVERIEAASRAAVDGGGVISTPSGHKRSLAGASLPSMSAEAAEDDSACKTHDLESLMKACAQALEQAARGDGFQPIKAGDGLRITARCPIARTGSAAGRPLGKMLAISVAPLAALIVGGLLFVDSDFFGSPLGVVEPTRAVGRVMLQVVFCIVFSAITGLLLRLAPLGRGERVPIVCATARVDCPNEDLRELLAEPSICPEWCWHHVDGRSLSLVPAKEEVIFTKFKLGWGVNSQMRSLRRWNRGSDGSRLLCSVAEAEGDGGGIVGFEGFGIISCEEKADSACMVAWMCALDLAPWAPWFVRQALAVRRVSALVGLREWVSSPSGRRYISTSRMARIESRDKPTEHLAGIFAQPTTSLQGLRRATGGGLCRPMDTERAVASAQMAMACFTAALSGGQRVQLRASPVGLQPLLSGNPPNQELGTFSTQRPDMATKYASRWAYASAFLLGAGQREFARDRILCVVAFLISGLHLGAISYPHTPWVSWPGGVTRFAATLQNECKVRIDVGQDESTCVRGGAWRNPSARSNGCVRRSTFEMQTRSGGSFRIFGSEDVVCRAGNAGAGSFMFIDRGVTTVELLPGGQQVRFTVPELHVRPEGWRHGLGSIYEWRGSAHVIDEAGGVQCDLCFGTSDGLESDSVAGTVRGVQGMEIGRIRGSWLGTVTCDGEPLWRGPIHQPARL